MDKKVKYNPEATLNLYVKSALLIRNDHISKLKEEELNKYNLYCVLAAERPCINGVRVNNDIIEVDITQDDNKIRAEITISKHFQSFDKHKFSYTDDELSLYFTSKDIEHNKFKYSGVEGFIEFSTIRKIEFKDEKYLLKLNLSADYYWLTDATENKKRMKFDLLYVGQSSRMAGRINSHKTIQKIQADYMNKNRTKNIYLLLLEIDMDMLMSMNGLMGETDNEIDKKHISALVNDIQCYPFDQVVNITEALLIYHFKPPYNDKFMNNFPNAKHSSFQHYFELDYESIFFEFYSGLADFPFKSYEDFPIIELSTRNNSISNIIPSGNIEYQLHKDKNRASIFDIFKTKPKDGS